VLWHVWYLWCLAAVWSVYMFLKTLHHLLELRWPHNHKANGPSHRTKIVP
jgi:hypothetical protein